MNFNEVSDILRNLFLQYGKELFLNNQRFKAALADVLPHYPKEKRLIELAVDENIVKRIVEEPRFPSSAIKTSLAQILTEKYAIIPKVSFQLVDVFSYAVHGNRFSDGRTDKQKSKTSADSSCKDQPRSGQSSSGVKSVYSRKFSPGTNETNVDRSVSGSAPTSILRQNPDGSRDNELQPEKKKQTNSSKQTSPSPQARAATAGGQKNNAVPPKNYKKKIIIDLALLFFGLPVLFVVFDLVTGQSISNAWTDTIRFIFSILNIVLAFRLIVNICMNKAQKRRGK